ncbi:LacI family transcriptional regulator [Georgenia wutianyii]|uniref:LacI family transcriptional regulator n=1 Tax=Georgenia wutianyii TaxID=2585135 RepID=A0ABX5VM53_9MICO|nr:LacI family DNA-binding transcriptional regulator [Georgenia wutianyii]QDB79579.1 LacI family transcriptional regulator [Georgenia wutianyii]
MTRESLARRPTIRDVADLAGVSTATVSYVLNGTAGQTITPSTRERVRRAADSVGYVPHRIARALREGRSPVVLLNVGAMIGGSTVATLVEGMSAELRRHGHSLLVTAEPGGIIADVIDAVAPRATLDLTVVTTGGEEDDVVSGVAAGDHAGFAFHTLAQLRHLVERGHRRIAFVGPAEDVPFARTRRAHARSAARQLGLPPLVETVIGGDEARRAETVERLVREEGVSAVAAHSDDVALAVLAGMATLGLRAPQDLAVIGFDEDAAARLWRPSLTTVRIDGAAYGRRAARVVLGLPVPEWDSAPSQVVLGEST